MGIFSFENLWARAFAHLETGPRHALYFWDFCEANGHLAFCKCSGMGIACIKFLASGQAKAGAGHVNAHMRQIFFC